MDGPVLKLAAPVTGKLLWRLEDDTRLHLKLEAERPGLALLPATQPWYLDPETGECGPLETGLGAREAGLLAMAPALIPQSADTLGEAVPAPLRTLALPLPAHTERRRVASESPTPCLHLQSKDLNADIAGRYWGVKPEPSWSHSAVLTFAYGPFGTVDPRDRKETLERVEQGMLLESGRDLAGESAAIRALEGLGLIRSLGDEYDVGLCFELPDDGAWLRFMGRDIPRLVEQGWRIHAEDGFHFQIAHLGDDWQIEIAEYEGQHWFDLGLGVEVDGERLDLLPLLVDLIQRYQADFSLPMLAQMQDEENLQVRLDDGRLILMPAGRLRPTLSTLSTLIELYDPQRPLTGDGRLRLSGLQATQLAELEAADPRLIFRGGEASRAWGRRLKEFQGLTELDPPTGLATELRPYQRRRLDWLQFLREYDLGGILADDMGLGKTVQALAHLLVERESGRSDRPSLG